MSHRVAYIIAALLVQCLVKDSSESSVEFPKSAGSVVESGKSDEFARTRREYEKRSVDSQVANEGSQYLSNFRKLNNSTDLEAQASESHAVVASPEKADKDGNVSTDRADLGYRILRGTDSDHPGLDYPLFSPHKHNTIDTADFSDCALQGEWHPIGVPHTHYGHHEDSQKEHFHAAAEGPEAFPSVAVHSTKHPLDTEGATFWNQFINENKEHHHQPPSPPPVHHSKGATSYNEVNHKPKHHYHHKKRQPTRPPPPPHPPSHFGDGDLLKTPRKPSHLEAFPFKHESPLQAQSLISQKPTAEDLDFALIHKNPHSGPDSAPTINYKDTNYLSPPPPPLPAKLHGHKTNHFDKPPRQKYMYKPPVEYNKPKPHHPHHNVKGRFPHRTPPKVLEDLEETVSGDAHPQHHHNADSSTFTCGHQHSHGTNYHTASYQVEGESDPSILDESPHESIHFPTAQIILGQPQFEHEHNFRTGEDDLIQKVNNHRFPKTGSAPPADLKEEGTEIGNGDHDDLIIDKDKLNAFTEQILKHTKFPESSTPQSFSSGGPQTFQAEIGPPQHYISRDSIEAPDTIKSVYTTSFDHSGFVKVDHNSPSASFHVGDPPKKAKLYHGSDSSFNGHHHFKEKPSQVIVHKEHSFSHSEPNSFFGPEFGAFIHGNNDPKHYPSIRPNKHPILRAPPTSFIDYSSNHIQSHTKENVAVPHHGPPHNGTKSHISPKNPPPSRPNEYEVNENSGEMIPLSAFFPPRKGPTQFNNRPPNFAGPAPKKPNTPPTPKYQSTIHYDGSNLDIHQTRPKSSVTRIKLKKTRGGPRLSEPDFRRSLTIKSRID